ncbi:NACHT domain-containing protein [Anabaena sp. CCY 9910]|uniref:NACHT domain-containing protein n=1 Tax=Anabaena sp. CCY 9910 TaxID=3103870 RepID=UPI0039DF8F8A
MPDAEDPKQINNNDLRNAQFGSGLINADTVNAGRIGGDILNFFFGQQTTPVGNPARPKNERILLAAVKEEVTARLSQSLHNAVLINLGKESQPQQVKRPWDTEIKIGLKPPKPLPDTTTILEVFDSPEIAGKLLILGAPGSGKTTTQLELAQELIKRAEEQPDYPVPVLFNLSSWKNDRQSITNWLVTELNSKYGVSNKLGQEWVNNYQLLPLLDGLDELESQSQELCVDAINQFLTGETRPLYLVVCSRIEEYNNYSTQLQLNGAIYLQPLSNNQICGYLTYLNSIELWSTISSDLNILDLVKTPLLLSITILISQDISFEEWQHFKSTGDRVRYLLNTYIYQMLARNINSRAYFKYEVPNAIKTRMWLVWLAQQMQQESKYDFLIEQMQPSLLKTKINKIIYNCTVWGAIGGLISGSTSGLTSGSISESIFWSIFGLIFGLISGLISGLTNRWNNGLLGKSIENTIKQFIEFIESKIEEISYLGNIVGIFNKTTTKWLNIGLISGSILGLIFGLRLGLTGGLILVIFRLIFCLVFGIVFGLINGMMFGLIGDEIHASETIIFPVKKFLNVLIYILIHVLCFLILNTLSLSYLLNSWLTSGLYGLNTALSQLLKFGLLLGVNFGLFFGLAFGINVRELENKTIPNQGTYKSITNTINISILVTFFATLSMLLIKIVLPSDINLKQDLSSSLVFGLFLGIFIGITKSGTPAIKHFALRLILYFNGYIPWNYARFLDYCTERMLLQRVGGRYRFIHKLLQDHFAQMEFRRD